MKRNRILILTLLLGALVCKGQIKHKMFVGAGNSGQYKLNILPYAYDSTVSDSRILKSGDSLSSGLFDTKMYNLLYKGDSGHLAIQVNEGDYMFSFRKAVVEYWKNGNIKRTTYYKRHSKKYWEFDYYEDASPKAKGKYNGDTKKGTWFYYNTEGKLVKKEHYSKDGTLKSSKDINPPKKTATTTFNPKHPNGNPYVIQ